MHLIPGSWLQRFFFASSFGFVMVDSFADELMHLGQTIVLGCEQGVVDCADDEEVVSDDEDADDEADEDEDVDGLFKQFKHLIPGG